MGAAQALRSVLDGVTVPAPNGQIRT
jgi:hypothetical protein